MSLVDIFDFIFIKNLIYFFYISAGIMSFIGMVIFIVFCIRKCYLTKSHDIEQPNLLNENNEKTLILRVDSTKEPYQEIILTTKISSKFKDKLEFKDAVIGFILNYEYNILTIICFLSANACLYLSIYLNDNWFTICLFYLKI